MEKNDNKVEKNTHCNYVWEFLSHRYWLWYWLHFIEKLQRTLGLSVLCAFSNLPFYKKYDKPNV